MSIGGLLLLKAARLLRCGPGRLLLRHLEWGVRPVGREAPRCRRLVTGLGAVVWRAHRDDAGGNMGLTPGLGGEHVLNVGENNE